MNRKLVNATDTMAEYGLMLLVWLTMISAVVGCLGLLLFVGWTAIKGIL